jgi:hypothetical protein
MQEKVARNFCAHSLHCSRKKRHQKIRQRNRAACRQTRNLIGKFRVDVLDCDRDRSLHKQRDSQRPPADFSTLGTAPVRPTTHACIRTVLVIVAFTIVAACAPNEMNPFCSDASDDSQPGISIAQRRASQAVQCDAQQIEGRISAMFLSPAATSALQQRARTAAGTATSAAQSEVVLSSRLPLSPAHSEMYQIAAEAERAAGSPSLMIWAANPWEPLHPLERPATSSTDSLATSLMRGERRSVAFNVRSVRAEPVPMRIKVTVPGLASDALRILRVNWTGTDTSDWVAAELEYLGDASSVQHTILLPGVAQQIWIEVHPSSSSDAGRFSGAVTLTVGDGVAATLPLEISVFSVRFPMRPSMHLGGWDFAEGLGSYGVTKTNQATFTQLLQERYVDTPWSWRHVMDWAHLDAQGNARGRPDTSRMQRWFSEWPLARRYRLHLHLHDYTGTIDPTSDRFRHAVATWARSWADEIRGLGKSPEQFDLLLIDEPRNEEQSRLTEVWAHAIRDSGAGFRIWTDPVWRDPRMTPQSLIDAVDTVAIHLAFAEKAGNAYWEWARDLGRNGKNVEVYACEGSAHGLDPYSYYRLTSWKAFFIGASAVSFWSFANTGGAPSDNEFAAEGTGYTPLFINGDVVRTAKHMEAAAQGIADVEYLRMLREVAVTNTDGYVRQRANELLHEAEELAFSSKHTSWLLQHEAGRADEQRTRIGEFLDSVITERPFQFRSAATTVLSITFRSPTTD